MNMRDILTADRFLLSAEVFPPKRTGEFESIIRTLRKLKEEVKPDYISVTYGANGKGAETTADAASVAIDAFDFETVAHITAVNMTREKLDGLLDIFLRKGVDSILTLRGDVREDSRFYDFAHANELAAYIKTKRMQALTLQALLSAERPQALHTLLRRLTLILPFRLKAGHTDRLLTHRQYPATAETAQ